MINQFLLPINFLLNCKWFIFLIVHRLQDAENKEDEIIKETKENINLIKNTYRYDNMIYLVCMYMFFFI